MKRATGWGLGLTAAAVLFVLFSDFIPKAGMIGRPRAESSVPAATVSSAGYRSPGERHKISVSDRQLVQTLKSQGGRVIGDYDGFVLMEANEAVSNSLANNSSAQIVDENNLILLNAGAIDTSTPAAQSRRATNSVTTGKQMRLIQFAGPIRPEWYQALVATGARVVTYIPNNAYLVYGSSQTLQAVQQLASNPAIAQWDGEYTAAFRVDPAVSAGKSGAAQGKNRVLQERNLSAAGNPQFTIQMVEDQTENLATLALINQFKLEPIIKQDSMLGYFNVRVALPKDVVTNQIAERGDVVSIQQWITPKKRDERQDIIISGNVTGNPAIPTPMDYLAYLAGKGFSTSTTAGFAVNLSDSGIDNATTTPNHFALYRVGDPTVPANSRIIYNRLLGTPNGGSTLQGCDGHGNENSHIICGYVPTGTVGGVNFGAAPHADASAFRWDLGVAPFVKVGSSVIFDPNTFTSPTYQNLESQAYNDGARISSNSWGSSLNTYTVDAQQYDGLVRDAQPDTGCVAPNCITAVGNQEYVIVFAAGNDGSGSNTVGEPGTGKNVITVGAAENVSPFGGADNCGIGDTGADNANDIISFSSRGPTSDGRKKPDIMAPGTHVSAGVAQAAIASPTGSGTGAQLACFTGGGVCGGTGGSNFFPAGQQWYTASSGTSHSTPAIAGVAALIRQHFINQAAAPPSAAMTKALMLDSARYMNGVGANDTLPSNNQGMGEISLNNYFDTFATAHSFHDQLPAETFTATGQQRLITGTVNDNAKPFRVTLAWTDTPGPTSGNAFVNNLDLEVTVGGNTYKGNVFSGAFSAIGGLADTRNNVESVFLPAGVTGTFVIRVKATNIAGDGVPNNAQPLDQDFALVAYNVVEAPLPVISPGATAITAESCAPANNAIDPTEIVTINFDLSNLGAANTTNLVATLLSTGGVTSPSGPQNYGILVANGPAVTRPFTFTVGTTCGQTLTATFHLQDGATDLGNVTFTFLTGGLGAPATATYSTGNIITLIPDISSVEVPINISDTGVITDVNVKLRANHTFDGDLVFELVGPDGTTVTLAANRGGAGANYGSGATDCSGTHTVFDDSAATAISAGTAPFAGTFRPESPLSAFNGKTITGQWKLRATDTEALDTGTVFCVQLEITRQRFVCCGVPGSPLIVSGGSPVITSESVSPANNAPDPDETITVNLPVLNTGDGDTTNLVGTLQATGGVNGPSAPQNYGVVVAAGPIVSRPFTFAASGTCGNIITLTLALQDGALNLGTIVYTLRLGTVSSQTFSNPAAITITDCPTGCPVSQTATPYPSNITVVGAPTTISKITVTINQFNHTFPDDVDILLVSPTGRKMIVMSDAGFSTVATNLSITLDDDAATGLPDGTGIASGTFKPSNYGTVQDPFPAPAPAGPYLTPQTGGTDTLTSAFTGVAGGNPNGIWSLYVVDDANLDSGNISGGWSLTLTSSNVCNTQTCNITAPTSVTIPPGTCGTVVNYSPAVSFTGACGVVQGPTPPSGSFFGIGTTTVFLRGTRADASFTDASFPVTVQENETQATGLGTNVTNNFCNTTVSYAAVTGAGSTTVVNAPAQTLPPPYVHCASCPELDITTTASFTAPLTICVTVPASVDFNTFSQLRILHGEPGLVNRTISSNFGTRTICAGTSTLSPIVFALDPSAPTAAPAMISGQVTTPNGLPVPGVAMRLTGQQTVSAITDEQGNYRFADVSTDGFYTVTPELANHHFSPANRSFSLLANKADAVFTASADAVPSRNPIDTNEFFVRQQYRDFLGREPESAGLNYWTSQLNQCNGDDGCLRTRRLDVSAAFFMSQEFRDTGLFVYKLYAGALGRQLTYAEFSAGRQQVVGGPNIAASKAAFANGFVGRAEFVQRYLASMSGESFVDAVLQSLGNTSGVDLSSERANLIGRYNSGSTMNESRSLVVQDVAENAAFSNKVNNPSFVLMEYYGYLRRPLDQDGYSFWLNVLNNGDPGNYRGMVCSFITSTEYQLRFGTVVTRSNADCSR